MNVLLHTCCAPCLIYPLERLTLDGFKVTGFYYNPNIHPLAEYTRRKEALGVLAPGLEIIYAEYSPVEFFRAVNLKKSASPPETICNKLE